MPVRVLAPEEVEDLYKKATLAEAVEYAAVNLPEGWSIVLAIEKGAATVCMVSPTDNASLVDPCDRSLAAQIFDSTRVLLEAKKAAEKLAKGVF